MIWQDLFIHVSTFHIKNSSYFLKRYYDYREWNEVIHGWRLLSMDVHHNWWIGLR